MIVKEERLREAERWVTKEGSKEKVLEKYQERYSVVNEYREKLKPYDDEINLYNFPNSYIASDQFNIPFSFLLPTALPASFEHEWKSDAGTCTAKIRYSVKVYLIGAYQKPITQFEKIFYVIPKQLANVHPDYKESSHTIAECHCCRKGVIKTKAYTEKNAYYCGQQIWMVIECENNTTCKIKGIYAEFEKVITVMAEGHRVYLNDTNTGISGGSLQRGDLAIGQNAKRVSVSTKNSINHSFNGTNYHNSCQGRLIQCNYYIIAKLVPDLNCNMSGNPKIKFPVFMTVQHVQENADQINEIGKKVQDLQQNNQGYISSIATIFKNIFTSPPGTNTDDPTDDSTGKRTRTFGTENESIIKKNE